MNKFLKLITSLVLVYATAFFGSYFTFPSIKGWYATLIRPSFSPPNWIFGPVWTVLYLMMAISFYLIWEKNKFFFAQLFLNFLWSLLFFGLHQPLFAFFDIVLLWIFILLTILDFRKKSKTASFLLIPYLLWVSFASILNLSIVLLN
jgi:tryptophan-rich sensory protein